MCEGVGCVFLVSLSDGAVVCECACVLERVQSACIRWSGCIVCVMCLSFGFLRRPCCVFIVLTGSAFLSSDGVLFARWVPLLASLRVWSSVVVSAFDCAVRTPRPFCVVRVLLARVLILVLRV